MAASVAKGASLSHISRESSDIRRLANFYKKIFGFEIESPDSVEFKVIWLNLASVQIHLIERNRSSRLPKGPWSATLPILLLRLQFRICCANSQVVYHLRRITYGVNLFCLFSGFETVGNLSKCFETVGKSSLMGRLSKSSLIPMVMDWRLEVWLQIRNKQGAPEWNFFSDDKLQRNVWKGISYVKLYCVVASFGRAFLAGKYDQIWWFV